MYHNNSYTSNDNNHMKVCCLTFTMRLSFSFSFNTLAWKSKGSNHDFIYFFIMIWLGKNNIKFEAILSERKTIFNLLNQILKNDIIVVFAYIVSSGNTCLLEIC